MQASVSYNDADHIKAVVPLQEGVSYGADTGP